MVETTRCGENEFRKRADPKLLNKICLLSCQIGVGYPELNCVE